MLVFVSASIVILGSPAPRHHHLGEASFLVCRRSGLIGSQTRAALMDSLVPTMGTPIPTKVKALVWLPVKDLGSRLLRIS